MLADLVYPTKPWKCWGCLSGRYLFGLCRKESYRVRPPWFEGGSRVVGVVVPKKVELLEPPLLVGASRHAC